MAYGIMNIQKRKRSAVYGIEKENNRSMKDHKNGQDFKRSDIDWDRTDNNICLERSNRWNDVITKKLQDAGVKERKDSIVLLDAVYTASPEWFKNNTLDDMKAYFDDCLSFHAQEFCQNDKSRIINAVIHLDEKTPHLHVCSVPLYTDEHGTHLSAKTIMGNRSDYSRRQEEFYRSVSQFYRLERGERSDPEQAKKHQTKTQWIIREAEQQEQETMERLKRAQEKEEAFNRSAKNRQFASLKKFCKEYAIDGDTSILDVYKLSRTAERQERERELSRTEVVHYHS